MSLKALSGIVILAMALAGSGRAQVIALDPLDLVNARFGPDNKVYVSGGFTGADNSSYRGNIRLNANGSIDNTFTASTSNPAYSLGFFGDGSYLVNGSLGGVIGLQKFSSNGVLDNSFPDSIVGPRTLIVSGSSFYTGAGKYSSDGSLVFNYSVSFTTLAMALQNNGQIMLGGTGGQLVRLNADGTVDSGFSAPASITGGNVQGLAVQGDGKIVVTGSGFSSAPNVFRLNVDGSYDFSFISGTTVNGPAYALNDGTILIAGGNNGTSISFDSSGRVLAVDSIVRLSSNGSLSSSQLSLDASFNQTLGLAVYGTPASEIPAVPEPSTFGLLAGLGALAVALLRRSA